MPATGPDGRRAAAVVALARTHPSRGVEGLFVPADAHLRLRAPAFVTTHAADGVELVRELVSTVMNGRDLSALERLCTERLAPKLRRAFEDFVDAFPDWHQELVEVVADDTTVVARFRCTGTHLGMWQGLAPTGRQMRIDEVYFFRIADGRIAGLWGLEDTWTRMRQLAGDDATLGELGSLG